MAGVFDLDEGCAWISAFEVLFALAVYIFCAVGDYYGKRVVDSVLQRGIGYKMGGVLLIGSARTFFTISAVAAKVGSNSLL